MEVQVYKGKSTFVFVRATSRKQSVLIVEIGHNACCSCPENLLGFTSCFLQPNGPSLTSLWLRSALIALLLRRLTVEPGKLLPAAACFLEVFPSSMCSFTQRKVTQMATKLPDGCFYFLHFVVSGTCLRGHEVQQTWVPGNVCFFCLCFLWATSSYPVPCRWNAIN